MRTQQQRGWPEPRQCALPSPRSARVPVPGQALGAAGCPCPGGEGSPALRRRFRPAGGAAPRAAPDGRRGASRRGCALRSAVKQHRVSRCGWGGSGGCATTKRRPPRGVSPGPGGGGQAGGSGRRGRALLSWRRWPPGPRQAPTRGPCAARRGRFLPSGPGQAPAAAASSPRPRCLRYGGRGPRCCPHPAGRCVVAGGARGGREGGGGLPPLLSPAPPRWRQRWPGPAGSPLLSRRLPAGLARPGPGGEGAVGRVGTSRWWFLFFSSASLTRKAVSPLREAAALSWVLSS